VAIPCARLPHGPVAGLDHRQGQRGQAVSKAERQEGSARSGQGKTGIRDGGPTLGGQGVDRNKLAKVVGFAFPTIALLPSTDKDLPAGFGVAKRFQIHLRDVAYPVLRGGQQAEAGPVPPLLPPGAAGGLGKHHHVLGHRSGNLQLDAQPTVCVVEAQRLDRVRAKGHRGGRPEEHLAVNPCPGIVNPYEMLLPGQRTTLAKSAPAQDFRRRNDPGLLLFGGQESAEGF
jgi:hypothetical protein